MDSWEHTACMTLDGAHIPLADGDSFCTPNSMKELMVFSKESLRFYLPWGAGGIRHFGPPSSFAPMNQDDSLVGTVNRTCPLVHQWASDRDAEVRAQIRESERHFAPRTEPDENSTGPVFGKWCKQKGRCQPQKPVVVAS